MLEISDVKAWRLREPVSKRAYTVVRVQAGSFSGYGECGAVTAEQVDRAKKIILKREATAYEAIRRDLASMTAMQSAIDMALLDITGKFAKAPVYQVLGGPTRNKVRAMAMLDGSDPVASMRIAQAAGFRAFSVPVPQIGARNQGRAFVDATKKRMEALRAAGGEDVDFVLDGGGGLSPGDSGSIAAALERFHLLWFDEPCAISNLSALRKIGTESVTPLGFGRTIHAPGRFQDLLREDAIDILRPSLAQNGITQIRRMAVIAETYYVAVAPYHEGGPVMTAAALQLAAALPNFFIQQIPAASTEDRKMRAEIAGAAIETVRDGYAPLPTGPGLGITVNEQALAKYEERAA